MQEKIYKTVFRLICLALSRRGPELFFRQTEKSGITKGGDEQGAFFFFDAQIKQEVIAAKTRMDMELVFWDEAWQGGAGNEKGYLR